ncbi:MAG: STAS domain-containing protein [Methanimicrococcus sp.]|nr:STAS domain-containing protein [Methanimicrococcus sp.]
MDIQIQRKDSDLQIILIGRLDANTAPQLQEKVDFETDFKSVEIDFGELEYISSAGLRVLLAIHKNCLKNDSALTLFNCNETVKDILNMTGFTDVLYVR